jgi:hypothetical protein
MTSIDESGLRAMLYDGDAPGWGLDQEVDVIA